MIKKLLLTLASIFLTYRSLELIRVLEVSDPSQFNWIGVVVYSFVLNLFITGIFASLGFAFLTSRLLPDSYYRVKNAKRLTLAYKLMGVEHFKSLLLLFFWGKEKNRKKYFDGTKSGIENFDTQTRQSEFGHLAAFIGIIGLSVIVLAHGHVAIFLTTTLINIVGNLYPVLLQRNHRIQIQRMQRVLDTRKFN
jgi:hypothetical protein